MTPEEKLLRAIFGEKASDVRDTSLRMPPGDFGTVVEVRVFNRHGVDKDERALQIEREEIERLARDRDDEVEILERNIYARLKEMILRQDRVKGPKGVKPGSTIDDDLLASACPAGSGGSWRLAEEGDAQAVEALNAQYQQAKKVLEARFEDKVEKVRRGDDLPPGGMKMVKVFVAVKRKLQPGDKMAGRHGNKGVISRVVPDGGHAVPGRRDAGRLRAEPAGRALAHERRVRSSRRTLAGRSRTWARASTRRLQAYREHGDMTPVQDALKIAYGDGIMDQLDDWTEEEIAEAAGNVTRGVPIATPVFDGAKETDVTEHLEKAGLHSSGQSTVYDGRTGEEFARPVTVGYKYLLKLHHLVDDKIHARSTGPYSLVTQQPLGGKAQFGGQRFGEMEVWALEAYGAAYTLQEMLTVKSDDVAGRTKVYESIVKGEDNFEAGIPESFNVLVKEIRSLGLNVELMDSEEDV